MHIKRWMGAWTAGALLFAGSAAAVEAAAAIEIGGIGTTRTEACGGENVTLVGSRNVITLTGDCPRLDITGSNNTVNVDGLGRVEITGISNTVNWQRSLAGDRPAVADTGIGNRVAQGSEESPPQDTQPESDMLPDLELPDLNLPDLNLPSVTVPTESFVSVHTLVHSGQEHSADCGNGVVILVGNDNKLTLTGLCEHVNVLGSGNQVWVQQARNIEVAGDLNTVTWESPIDDQEPSVTLAGTHSTVSQGPLP